MVTCCWSSTVDVGRGTMVVRTHLEVSFPTVPMGGGNMAVIKLLILGADLQNQASAEARGGLVVPKTMDGCSDDMNVRCQPSCASAEIVQLIISILLCLHEVLRTRTHEGHRRNMRQGSMRVHGAPHIACLRR